MTHGSILLLGGFQVYHNDGPLTGFQSDKARALLAYLAVEAHRPHQRAQLAGLFWPEYPDHKALTYLRHALANLRKILIQGDTPQPFRITRHTLQFTLESGYCLDVATLLHALGTLSAPAPDIAQLQQAVEQYAHPFLDGFYLHDCAAFEEWVLLTRTRIQRQIVDTLRYLADHFEAEGAYRQACHYAQRCLELEPWLEDTHRQLMRLHAAHGQRGAALAQYESCCRQLAAELHVEPSEETQALAMAIRAGRLEQRTLWQQANKPLIVHNGQSSMPASGHPVKLHNLPASPTPLLGRTKELANLYTLLQRADVRLVTVTGPGGVGKTRLGVEVARQFVDYFADGVFVTFLVAIREAALVLSAIAQTLDVREIASQPLIENLKTTLHNRHLLLILDNFEHVAAAAPLIAELLMACPRLKVLVTSRERLRLQGEYEYSTPPLPVPDFATAPTLANVENLEKWPAIELFYQRTLAARHGFLLTPENVTAISAICARLDGLPLAIELAAARSKLFSLPALLERLTRGDALRQFLKVDLRDVPNRHRSLWNTIAWSYALLAPDEQAFFRQLTVFVGGCTVAAAAAVCLIKVDAAFDPLDRLTALVDKNLLGVEPNAGELRFTMLETIREFGLAQLVECQEIEETQARHAHYFAQWVAVISPRLMGADSTAALAELLIEYPNIRIAFRCFLANQQVEACLAFCDKLLHFWAVVEYLEDAARYLQATLLLAVDEPPSPAYVNTLASAGYVTFLRGQSEIAQRYFVQSLAMNQLIDNLGDPKKIGVANGLLAWIYFDQGDYVTARAYFAAAQANDMAAKDEWALAMTLANWGKMAARLGEFAQAEALLQEALLRHRRVDQVWGIALTLQNQALLCVLRGDFSAASRLLAEGQTLSAQGGIDKKQIDLSHLLGIVAMENSEYARASALLKAALLHEQAKGAARYVLPVLESVVQLAVRQTHFDAALSLAGAICAQRQQLKLVMPPVERQQFEAATNMARRTIGVEATTIAWAASQAMTMDEAVAYALTNCLIDLMLRKVGA